MNTPVSFELAKLLKEKGFESKEPIAEYWGIEGKQHLIEAWKDEYDSFHHENCPDDIVFLCLAPTIADVMMWFYEKHGIFIQPFPIGEEGKMKFYTKLIINDNGWVKIKHQISTIFNSPTEAYEAAFTYLLNNVI